MNQKHVLSTSCLALAVCLSNLAFVSAEDPRASMRRMPKAPEPAVYQDIKATLGVVPSFLRNYPPNALAGAWDELKAVQLSNTTALPAKEKELIGLAVAAQIPCSYCTDFHSRAAKSHGATDTELKEALALSSCARHWSTILYGMDADETRFRADVDAIMAKMKRAKAENAPMAMPAGTVKDLSTQEALYKEIEQTLGLVPEFMKPLPVEVLRGAWMDMRDLELAPTTALPPKIKALTSLAVSAQIPCRYCIYWGRAAAELNGASKQEIAEAVTMAALTRKWSTVLNGTKPPVAEFQREIKTIIK